MKLMKSLLAASLATAMIQPAMAYEEGDIIVRAGAATVMPSDDPGDAGGAKLEVSDNGYGFDLDHVSRGMGLANMQARAKKLGGTLSIQTAPGKGTSVQVLVPSSS